MRKENIHGDSQISNGFSKFQHANIKIQNIPYIIVSLNDTPSTQIRLTLVYAFVGSTFSICYIAQEMRWKCLVGACVRYICLR